MPRIFLSLSITSLLLIAAALVYGLGGGDYNGISQQLREVPAPGAQRDAVLAQLEPIQRHVRIHMLLGILASLVAVLVQSIGVTYFIGTGRWCKEVADAYQLDDAFVAQSSKLKRKAFPYAMLGIGAVLTISALGAAADPGTLRETTANWVAPHYWAGVLGLFVVATALWKQTIALRANQSLIESMLQRVKEVRLRRGLDVGQGGGAGQGSPPSEDSNPLQNASESGR